MPDEESATRTCDYCREEVKPEAIKCKHCGSRLAPEKPSHGGTCPFCKEQIAADALKCKHCKSALLGAAKGDEGCDCGTGGRGAGVPMSMARLINVGGMGGMRGMGGGVWTDPGHDCWGRCVDDYVFCRLHSPVPDFLCREVFADCKAGCPPSGPRLTYVGY
jgi:hypothetical protein